MASINLRLNGGASGAVPQGRLPSSFLNSAINQGWSGHRPERCGAIDKESLSYHRQDVISDSFRLNLQAMAPDLACSPLVHFTAAALGAQQQQVKVPLLTGCMGTRDTAAMQVAEGFAVTSGPRRAFVLCAPAVALVAATSCLSTALGQDEVEELALQAIQAYR